MKRSALVVIVSAVLVAAPAAAQWTGMPVWNDPKGGTGITISGEYGRPNSAYGKGNAWGGRAALGVGTVTLTAGGAPDKPPGAGGAPTPGGGGGGVPRDRGRRVPVPRQPAARGGA